MGKLMGFSCCCYTKVEVERYVAESYTRVEGMAMRTKDTDSCRHRR